MAAYVALLRGINVSGHNMIKMADLKAELFHLGFQNLGTYLQSGNVVFESDLTSSTALEKLISEEILRGFGFNIMVKVIGKREFQQAYKSNPFFANSEIDTKQLYYIHLKGEPDLDVFMELQNDEKFPEQMNLEGEVIYVNYVKGFGRSKLSGNILERKLKVSATARNHNTMKKLYQMLDNLG